VNGVRLNFSYVPVPALFRFVPALRPGTLILDEAVPELLRAAHQPTFITINVADFRRRLAPDRHFCVLCIALPDKRVAELSGLVRRVFATDPLRTRRSRLGKMD
jgi:hypothetical protein